MSKTATALASMSTPPAFMARTAHVEPFNPEHHLVRLRKTVEALASHIDRPSTPKPKIDAEAVWQRWREAGFAKELLNPLELRTLCIDPARAMEPALIDCLLVDSTHLVKRLTTFYGFACAYFANWGLLAHAEEVERLIRRLMAPGTIPKKCRWLDTWRTAAFLFTPGAAERLAKIARDSKRPPKEILDQFFIPQDSKLAEAVQIKALELAVQVLLAREDAIGEQELHVAMKYLTDFLVPKSLPLDVFRGATSQLILAKFASRFPSFTTEFVKWVERDERLGDPRLPGSSPNWRTMPQARELVLSWLARATLELFFNVLVPQNGENRRRAEFWLNFAKRHGKIKDFQVAVSWNDLPKIKAIRSDKPLYHSRITDGTASAFLMAIEGYGEDYVIIEFSENNNAAYVYKRADFEAGRISLRKDYFSIVGDLKRKSDSIFQISHPRHVSWEDTARQKLAEIGIRP